MVLEGGSGDLPGLTTLLDSSGLDIWGVGATDSL